MSAHKRLFLFAGYDHNGIIDDALVYYVSQLAKVGDIVLFMDSDVPNTELHKLSRFVLHASAKRHGEYDFGSYKRAYIWAKENLDLNKYDFVYMVNDSVYGPLFDIKPYLIKMESTNDDAFGLVKNPKREHPHIQSWFIGMRPSVFLSDWFNEFLLSVTHHDNKGVITSLYEHGFSKKVISHGGKWSCLYSVYGRGIYNKIKKLYRIKMPFMKKVAFTRHDGTLGNQIKYVLKKLPCSLRDIIIQSAKDAYGDEYITKILNQNKISGMLHSVKYGIKKFITGRL